MAALRGDACTMQLQLNLGNCGGGSLCTCGGWRKCGDLVVWVTVMQHTAVAAVQPIEGSRQAEATQQQRMRQLTRRRQNRIGLGPRSWSGPDDDDDDDDDDLDDDRTQRSCSCRDGGKTLEQKGQVRSLFW